MQGGPLKSKKILCLAIHYHIKFTKGQSVKRWSVDSTSEQNIQEVGVCDPLLIKLVFVKTLFLLINQGNILILRENLVC
jgi:hypothetical protein